MFWVRRDEKFDSLWSIVLINNYIYYNMKKMRFTILITAEQYQSYYQGTAKFVRVQTEDGRSLKFPAAELQKFVTHDGIEGRFEIIFNDLHKLVSLNKI